MKVYWVYNRLSDLSFVYSNMRIMSEGLGLSYHTLNYRFSRMGLDEYDNGVVLIRRVELEKSKRV